VPPDRPAGPALLHPAGRGWDCWFFGGFVLLFAVPLGLPAAEATGTWVNRSGIAERARLRIGPLCEPSARGRSSPAEQLTQPKRSLAATRSCGRAHQQQGSPSSTSTLPQPGARRLGRRTGDSGAPTLEGQQPGSRAIPGGILVGAHVRFQQGQPSAGGTAGLLDRLAQFRPPARGLAQAGFRASPIWGWPQSRREVGKPIRSATDPKSSARRTGGANWSKFWCDQTDTQSAPGDHQGLGRGSHPGHSIPSARGRKGRAMVRPEVPSLARAQIQPGFCRVPARPLRRQCGFGIAEPGCLARFAIAARGFVWLSQSPAVEIPPPAPLRKGTMSAPFSLACRTKTSVANGSPGSTRLPAQLSTGTGGRKSGPSPGLTCWRKINGHQFNFTPVNQSTGRATVRQSDSRQRDLPD